MSGSGVIAQGYRPALAGYDLQCAIEYVRHAFEEEFSEGLNLRRVSAPLFVAENSGLNDNLNGYERPVAFDVPSLGYNAEVVHSLAKWKRFALKRYGFPLGGGLYTDMNAIRRDETVDNIHSIYVDQWDWEKVISAENRTLDYLELIVMAIVHAIVATNERLLVRYPQVKTRLTRKVTFVTSSKLEELYPDLTPEEREKVYTKEYRTVFVEQIGAPLKNGKPHGGRAPDYDDWQLNGDLLFWDETLDRALEISSMGIRVDPESLARQLKAAGCEARRELPFHKMLLAGELPLTIGGGIGQSRLCMLLLGCAHIGEVQASLWDAATVSACKAADVPLL